ncbi:hypothetical protein B0H16DRAFT_1468219 [Mycena metata]|uniref:Uncharacterized protein n=1 Tax=Mycena metata TaxID=1033252 RepID=A0AAD7I1U4_9AGAR|nr:hypothetical protein B0H16DRAFT_1468219 [Mycena metata]
MPHFHILSVFMLTLLVGLATSSAELNRGRSRSTRQAPPSGARCKPISLPELKAMPIWQTFYDRLGVVVWGHPVGSYTFDLVGFSVETAFDDGSNNARVCSMETVDFQTIGEPICYVTTTYSPQFVTPASGVTRTDGYPTRYLEVGAPLTGGRTYETAFKVHDITPTGADSIPGRTNATYTVNGLYSDTLGNSFQVDANHEHDTDVILDELPGSICSIHYHNTTCIQDAVGQAAFTLYGAVRVGFNSRVNGHYYCISTVTLGVILNDSRLGYLWFDQWIPGDQAWSYSQSKATVTTTGSNDYSPFWECK